jgi:osmotically inducible protein OsmC
MATDRRAEVTWEGSLMEGSGTIESVGSGAFGPLDVSWPARAEDQGADTSPEELIAAAHASCFAMALSHGLAQEGHAPVHLSVSATVTFQPGEGIKRSVLDVEGNVSGLDEAGFRAAAEQAKDNCPVSKALTGNVELVLGGARLQGGGSAA